MNFVLILSVLLCLGSMSWAKAPVLIERSDTIPAITISSEELQNIPSTNRSVSDFLNLAPLSSEQNLADIDASAVKLKLSNNITLLNGKRIPAKEADEFLSSDASDSLKMIEKIEVLKGSQAALYGPTGSVINIITKRPFTVHPQELPNMSSFLPQEMEWQKQNIPFGRIGLSNQNSQWHWGLSTYDQNQWNWTSSWGLGESYGLSGPIVALGKTSRGTALSVFNSSGMFIGDVDQSRLAFDPDLTAKYLIRANDPYTFNDYHSYDRIYNPDDIKPYRVLVLPQYRSYGDYYQIAGFLNNRLQYSSRDVFFSRYYDDYDGYDDYDDDYDDDWGCEPPYDDEPVFQRSILKKAKAEGPVMDPNDPLYPAPKAKKKLKRGITGLIGNVLTIGGEAPMSVTNSRAPDVRDQYYLPQIGFTPKSDPHSAWNLVDAHSKNVVVAIIDSGLDLTHPDGPEFIWQNDKEIAGNNIDDDHDGYVDDVHGWNFLDENNDVKDLRGHGTIVAGIIAAKANNGQGIAGINPGAVIMPLKVADKHGNTTSLGIFRAIHYAVDHGAKVINISLGARGVSALERLAVNYARTRNVVVVIASGNNNDNIGIFGPSSSGGAIAVGALNFDGSRSTVSNWGPNNSLMTPGEAIFSLHSKDAPWDGPSGQKERLYTKESGTSFSAPMVAATASLLLVKNPQMSADDVENVLLSSAKHLDENAWNGQTGAGLLDAQAALKADPKTAFNIKITGLRPVYKDKKLNYVDVYATVAGDVDYFTVELGKGRHARGFKTVMGLAGQQAHDDLVAHLDSSQWRGSDEWMVLIRAKNKTGQEYKALTLFKLK